MELRIPKTVLVVIVVAVLGMVAAAVAIPLTLISSQTFKTGVLNLVYAPAESAGNGG